MPKALIPVNIVSISGIRSIPEYAIDPTDINVGNDLYKKSTKSVFYK